MAVQTDDPPKRVDMAVGTEILVLDETQKPEIELELVEELGDEVKEPVLSRLELEADFTKKFDLIQKETLLAQEFPSIARLRKGPNKSRQNVTVEIEEVVDQYLEVKSQAKIHI